MLDSKRPEHVVVERHCDLSGVPVLSAADCQCSPGYTYDTAAQGCEPCATGEYKEAICLAGKPMPVQQEIRRKRGDVTLCDIARARIPSQWKRARDVPPKSPRWRLVPPRFSNANVRPRAFLWCVLVGLWVVCLVCFHAVSSKSAECRLAFTLMVRDARPVTLDFIVPARAKQLTAQNTLQLLPSAAGRLQTAFACRVTGRSRVVSHANPALTSLPSEMMQRARWNVQPMQTAIRLHLLWRTASACLVSMLFWITPLTREVSHDVLVATIRASTVVEASRMRRTVPLSVVTRSLLHCRRLIWWVAGIRCC